MNCYYSYETPLGRLSIASNETSIIGVSFKESYPDYAHRETSLIVHAHHEIEEYLQGNRTTFDLPLKLEGTPFQIQVWQELQNIPYGETRSYTEIATKMGNKNACRAIGNANRQNPLMLLIPCHRVIANDGSLSGYAGGNLIKRYLLNLERGHHTIAEKPMQKKA